MGQPLAAKTTGQTFQPIPNPSPPVLEGSAGQRIFAAEPNSENSSLHSMADLSLVPIGRFAAWLKCHDASARDRETRSDRGRDRVNEQRRISQWAPPSFPCSRDGQ